MCRAVLAVALFGGLVQAQPRTTWSGVFTPTQAMAGESAYLERCAGCHQPDLSGGEDSPALAGPQFAARWDGRTLDAFFGLIRRSMPMDAPGSLSPAECAAVVAYVLQQNGFPAGASPLADQPQSLAGIRFAARQP